MVVVIIYASTATVLAVVTGHRFELPRLAPLMELEAALALTTHPLVRLALLLRPTGQGEALARAIAPRWKLSAKETKLLHLLVSQPPCPLDAANAHRLAYLHSNESAFLILLLMAAEGGLTAKAFAPLWPEAAYWAPPRLPVSGEDLKARGLGAGPDMGKALRQLEEAWIASDFALDKAALLGRL